MASGYEYAPRNGVAEEMSLDVHLSKFVKCDGCRVGPGVDVTERARNYVLREFKSTMFVLPSDLMERSHFVRCLEDVDRDSSPGYPLMRRFATNGDLFWDSEGNLISERVEMVWQMVRHQLVTRQRHPIRLFIKHEPHKIAKIRERRFRLIYSVSIVDTMIDRMLLSSLLEQLMLNWMRTPSMVGWSPLYGGWRVLPNDSVGYDLSAWEYTVTRWMIESFVWLVRELKVGGPETCEFGPWTELLSWRIDCLFNNAEIILSSGRKYGLGVYGIMKSGSYITIAANTMMQRMLMVSACFASGMERIPWQLAMGDDGLFYSELTPGALKKLEDWGFVIKDSSRNEFCGMSWDKGWVEPAYRGKHLAKFLFMPDDISVSLFASYQILYARSRWWDRLQQIIGSYDRRCLLPRAIALSYFDGSG